MASPRAYEQPTMNSAWGAFLEHVPTILLIWIATMVLSAVGLAAAIAMALVSVGIIGSGFGSEQTMTLASLLSQIGHLPFTVLSSLLGMLLVAVPALHYESGEVITVLDAFKALMQRPGRYLLAWILYVAALFIGTISCLIPGIAVALVMPIYVNRIFLSEQSISEVFTGSFNAVYGSQQGRRFAVIEILAWLLTLVVSLCTCGVGALLAVPVSSFYLQNAAYHQGIIK